MTAEIVIMNRMAVALAADSAVTFGPREGRKIVETANKLYTLSKYEPVAIMVYGNAELNEVPWETIIKTYRRALGTARFDHLKDYADHFVAFLGTSKMLFPGSGQESYFHSNVGGYFLAIREQIDTDVRELIKCQEEASHEDTECIVAKRVKEHYEAARKADTLPSVADRYEEVIIRKYGDVTDEIRHEAFGDLPMDERVMEQLRWIAGAIFSRDIPYQRNCGAIVAGFGHKDAFPSLVEFVIDGVINDGANYKELAYTSVGEKVSAVIHPFGQTEMVRGFLEGIEPDLAQLYHGYLSTMTSEYPRAVVANLPDLDDNEKQTLLEKLRQFAEGMLNDMGQDREKYIRATHVDPILSTVHSLPKVELASMAEALVELTSLKRKVSMEAETVGGPTDVAVISKGDGFVWIRRKHYFDADLNPAFFANYFRDDGAKGAPK